MGLLIPSLLTLQKRCFGQKAQENKKWQQQCSRNDISANMSHSSVQFYK